VHKNSQFYQYSINSPAKTAMPNQHLCCSGTSWKQQGAKVILSLRALIQSKGRWEQFWDKVDQFGVPACV
jgi:hypothetical protein